MRPFSPSELLNLTFYRLLAEGAFPGWESPANPWAGRAPSRGGIELAHLLSSQTDVSPRRYTSRPLPARWEKPPVPMAEPQATP